MVNDFATHSSFMVAERRILVNYNSFIGLFLYFLSYKLCIISHLNVNVFYVMFAGICNNFI